jgi:VWFA-related protein
MTNPRTRGHRTPRRSQNSLVMLMKMIHLQHHRFLAAAFGRIWAVSQMPSGGLGAKGKPHILLLRKMVAQTKRHCGSRGGNTSFAACGCVVLLGASSFAQQTGPLDSGVVIQSTTSLVQVRVVVQDAKGRVVTDLRRADFEILSDRKQQPLTFFAMDAHSTDGSGVTLNPSERSASMTSDSTSPSPSTRENTGYALIVLDWLNTGFSDRFLARDNVARLLKNFQPRQRLALYLLGRAPRLLLDFTTNGDGLLDALQAADREPLDIDDEPPSRFDARYSSRNGTSLNAEAQIFFWNEKVRASLHALELIADRLAHLPGRKTLVWVSAGFPMAIDGSVVPGAKPGEVLYLREIENLLTKLNAADVAVYSVDARGLPATSSRGFVETLQELSERTGGTAFYARNDLDEGVRLALEDMRATYTVGFQVPEGAAPGRHEIRVKVKRPGLKLRYRESYRLDGASSAR